MRINYNYLLKVLFKISSYDVEYWLVSWKGFIALMLTLIERWLTGSRILFSYSDHSFLPSHYVFSFCQFNVSSQFMKLYRLPHIINFMYSQSILSLNTKFFKLDWWLTRLKLIKIYQDWCVILLVRNLLKWVKSRSPQMSEIKCYLLCSKIHGHKTLVWNCI